jgi:hypothetical protein
MKTQHSRRIGKQVKTLHPQIDADEVFEILIFAPEKV